MKLKTYLTILLIAGAFVSVKNENNEQEDEDDTFVPTHEWKVVKKGQKVPEGLHVRMNLETGVTEAKLIDKDKPKNALQMVDEQVTDEEDQKLSPDEIKEALKNIKPDDPMKVYKKSFRSYEELKKEFGDINMNPKTDGEILRELIDKHLELVKQKDHDEEEILTILEDLEYLVHQYDNANDFVQLGGFKDIVYKNLNSTNAEIRRETLKLLGASMQNNVKVKIHALETGSVDTLLRILVLDNDISVKYRALFALSGLLRDFPFAQLKFIQNAGLSVFSKLFESDNLKIQLKMLTLINDLLQEEIDSKKHKYTDEKISQYKNVDLRRKLIENNYCEHLNNMIVNSVVIDSNDHDIIEKCLGALYSMIDDCLMSVTQKSKDIIVSLRNLYRKLSDKAREDNPDNENNYFSILYDMSNRIVKRFEQIKMEL